jgi:hypothetical protein
MYMYGLKFIILFLLGKYECKTWIPVNKFIDITDTK